MRPRFTLPALAAAAMLSTLLFIVLARPGRVAGTPAHAHDPAHLNMTEAEMEAWSKSWWASHPRVGTTSGQPPAEIFTVASFFFDNDGNAATQVDTARIALGESVRWQWADGIHSVTSGTDNSDPGAGSLFDQPSDLANPQFTFVFNSAGTFPFFCRPHDFLQMKGVVIVSSTTGVQPLPGQALGFISAPAPNPARRGVTFEFALRRAGRARAEVFDASGRRVAVVVNRDLDAGPHVAAWDGRANGGAFASPGLYWVRLRIPGYESSRAIVVVR